MWTHHPARSAGEIGRRAVVDSAKAPAYAVSPDGASLVLNGVHDRLQRGLRRVVGSDEGGLLGRLGLVRARK